MKDGVKEDIGNYFYGGQKEYIIDKEDTSRVNSNHLIKITNKAVYFDYVMEKSTNWMESNGEQMYFAFFNTDIDDYLIKNRGSLIGVNLDYDIGEYQNVLFEDVEYSLN